MLFMQPLIPLSSIGMKYPYVDLGFFPHHRHVANASTYVSKFHDVDCPLVVSSDVSCTVDPDLIDVLKSYADIEGTTFLLPMLTENVVETISFLYGFCF